MSAQNSFSVPHGPLVTLKTFIFDKSGDGGVRVGRRYWSQHIAHVDADLGALHDLQRGDDKLGNPHRSSIC